jgi:hypothetical protein
MDILTRAKDMYCNEHKNAPFNNEEAWAILRRHKKWDAPDTVDLTGDVPSQANEVLFGYDAQPRPMGKKRAAKKQKSETTASTGARVPKDLFRRPNSGKLCARNIGLNVKMRPWLTKRPLKTNTQQYGRGSLNFCCSTLPAKILTMWH